MRPAEGGLRRELTRPFGSGVLMRMERVELAELKLLILESLGHAILHWMDSALEETSS